ncbi:MAG TPA: HAD family hydrolase [Actinomycetota bacterium]|jgi:sugar-phosphatase|nr:HAD family hydrolase [Actinomycetota bacterium]
MTEREPVRTFECDAILFDLDGVLVDSQAVVVRTWHEWAKEKDLDADDAERILEVAHGRRPAEVLRDFAPELDADAEARELERMETNDLEGVLEIEGARELLSSLPADGWTVVTSGTRALASGRMEHVGLPLPERFVSADDVENGKPHPEAYLKGAEILGVSPEACVVVEDAPSGVSSARSAGMRVIAVATTYREQDLREADAVAPSLASIQAIPRPQHGAEGGPRFELRVTG